MTIGNLGGGGAEKGLVTFLKTFNRNLFDVEVLLHQKTGPYVNEIPNDITYHYLGLGKDFVTQKGILGTIASKYEKKKFKFYRSRPEFVYNRILKTNYDVEVTYIHSVMPYTKNSPIPKKIGWVRNDLSSEHYMSKKRRKEIIAASHQFDKLVCVSNDAKRSFVEMGGNEAKAVVIYNPIDVDTIEATLNNCTPTSKQESFTFIAVGRLVEQKRLDHLLQATKQLLEEGKQCKVLLVGNGPLEDELKQQVSELQLENNVEFTGFVKNPFCELQQADCYVTCSEHEGFSLTTAEAMYLHKPIIATPTNGPRELLQNGKLGKMIEPTVESLYNAMKEMIENENLRNDYVEKLKQEHFPFIHTNIVNQMEQLFLSV